MVRAAENPEARETTIRPAVVVQGEGPFERRFISAGTNGYENPEEPVSPATEVIPATVFIGGGAFVRGDLNADDRLNITDTIALLVYLFQGTDSPPPCLDAGDVNDDGRLNLTDGIYLLQWLFTAEALAPPEPHPGCGVDPTDDDVACKEIACGGG